MSADYYETWRSSRDLDNDGGLVVGVGEGRYYYRVVGGSYVFG
jgi:hypothetical protein